METVYLMKRQVQLSVLAIINFLFLTSLFQNCEDVHIIRNSSIKSDPVAGAAVVRPYKNIYKQLLMISNSYSNLPGANKFEDTLFLSIYDLEKNVLVKKLKLTSKIQYDRGYNNMGQLTILHDSPTETLGIVNLNFTSWRYFTGSAEPAWINSVILFKLDKSNLDLSLIKTIDYDFANALSPVKFLDCDGDGKNDFLVLNSCYSSATGLKLAGPDPIRNSFAAIASNYSSTQNHISSVFNSMEDNSGSDFVGKIVFRMAIQNNLLDGNTLEFMNAVDPRQFDFNKNLIEQVGVKLVSPKLTDCSNATPSLNSTGSSANEYILTYSSCKSKSTSLVADESRLLLMNDKQIKFTFKFPYLANTFNTAPLGLGYFDNQTNEKQLLVNVFQDRVGSLSLFTFEQKLIRQISFKEILDLRKNKTGDYRNAWVYPMKDVDGDGNQELAVMIDGKFNLFSIAKNIYLYEESNMSGFDIDKKESTEEFSSYGGVQFLK